MSRLDELLELRRQIDEEIERERLAQARARKIQIQAAATMTRGNWNTRVFYAACDHFDVSPDEVLEGRRGHSHINARHVAMWLMRDARRSLPEIGRELGMDHTSVRNGVLRVENDAELLAVAYLIREALTGEKAA